MDEFSFSNTSETKLTNELTKVYQLLEELKVTVERQKHELDEARATQENRILILEKIAGAESEVKLSRADRIYDVLFDEKYNFVSRHDPRLTDIIAETSKRKKGLVKTLSERVGDTITLMKDQGYAVETVRDARSRNVPVPTHITEGFRVIPPADLEPYKGSFYVPFTEVATIFGKTVDDIRWIVKLANLTVKITNEAEHISIVGLEKLKRTFAEVNS